MSPGNQIYEDDLPENMTDDEYDFWYQKSIICEGVRMGPKITAKKTENDYSYVMKFLGAVFPDDLHLACSLYTEQHVLTTATHAIITMRKALESIAANTCCDKCQEEKQVAKKALVDIWGEK